MLYGITLYCSKNHYFGQVSMRGESEGELQSTHPYIFYSFHDASPDRTSLVLVSLVYWLDIEQII